MRDEEGRSTKKMKVELYGERIVCNYAMRTGSQHELVIDTGNIDETPPVYLPFHRSTSDVHMYHQEYCTQGIIKTVAIGCEGSNEVQEEELTMMSSGVFEGE